MRKDLDEFYKRKEFLKDKNRSESVKKRHGKGSRTARENMDDLCDKDSFNELGTMQLAEFFLLLCRTHCLNGSVT